MTSIRPAAVAGRFYPANPEILTQDIDDFFAQIPNESHNSEVRNKAFIVPHAGYIYSGIVAAKAYKQLAAQAESIQRLVLIGPAHRQPFYGIAAPSADAFSTPLGDVSLDQDAIHCFQHLNDVMIYDAPHQFEHCLEVQLPFLQKVLTHDFKIIPLLVGTAEPKLVENVLELLWGDDATVFLISSDLSHYLDHDTACERDKQTSQAIIDLDAKAIEKGDACGRVPIQAWLNHAKKHHLKAELLDLRNSGDTAGPKEHVVGYAAFGFY